jgi:formylglycine-generating enzyme required for sulfatase activity
MNNGSWEKKEDKSGAFSSNHARLPQMILIPAGPFLMGTSDMQIQLLLREEDWAQEWFNSDLFSQEQPQHQVILPDYEIAKYPVTNIEYYSFIYHSGHRVPKGWVGFQYLDGQGENPVAGVSLRDAQAYCEWLNGQTNGKFRLPSEAEWEKAARGTEGRIFPWGDAFDPWRCNTDESGKRSTTPVGTYSPGGDSIYELGDVSGNVWEWTASLFQPYPYKSDDGRENLSSKGKFVVRGGAWYYSRALARCAARESMLPDYVSPAVGFRLARSV